LHQNSNRANAALFSAALNGCFRLLENVNACVYEPSAFRVVVAWPRAPMYLPVPPKTGRTTGLSAANSPAVGE
jgi:hypothetical protein